MDGRSDLVRARDVCRSLHSDPATPSVLVVLTEGGLVILSTDWGATDVVVDTAGPAEVEARLRLARDRPRAGADPREEAGVVRTGELRLDWTTSRPGSGEFPWT